jgi:hypothetical protein
MVAIATSAGEATATLAPRNGKNVKQKHGGRTKESLNFRIAGNK